MAEVEKDDRPPTEQERIVLQAAYDAGLLEIRNHSESPTWRPWTRRGGQPSFNAPAGCYRVAPAAASKPAITEQDRGYWCLGHLRRIYGAEAFAAAARPHRPGPGLLWTTAQIEAVEAALSQRAIRLAAEHNEARRRDGYHD